MSGPIGDAKASDVEAAISKGLKNNGFKKTSSGWESSTHTAKVTVEEGDYAEVRFTAKAKASKFEEDLSKAFQG